MMNKTTPGAAEPTRTSTTAIILCGGAGRRAGGADKPLFEFANKPLVAHVAASLQPLVSRILISANRNPHLYSRYGEVIADKAPGFTGPLSGVAACLEQTDTPFAIVCPGDAPRVTTRLWQKLLDALSTSEKNVVCAQDGTRRQPLFLAINCRSPLNPLTHLERYLAGGQRSVLGWLERIGAMDVDCADLAVQLEDVDDLGELQSLARSSIRPIPPSDG
ncbi:MAG: molybdenum cofactor guanylyltransferase MobA [Pseudomonadales bacterium]|nr:molybdenum cofactor guanylyltransferase [Pseudomonadales bacterium]